MLVLDSDDDCCSRSIYFLSRLIPAAKRGLRHGREASGAPRPGVRPPSRRRCGFTSGGIIASISLEPGKSLGMCLSWPRSARRRCCSSSPVLSTSVARKFLRGSTSPAVKSLRLTVDGRLRRLGAPSSKFQHKMPTVKTIVLRGRPGCRGRVV